MLRVIKFPNRPITIRNIKLPSTFVRAVNFKGIYFYRVLISLKVIVHKVLQKEFSEEPTFREKRCHTLK